MTGIPKYDKLVDQYAYLPVADTMTMRVCIVDVKRAYGRTDVQVVPVDAKHGTGAMWVNVRKLRRVGERS